MNNVDLLSGLLLGLLQGVGEWLPVSSSGQTMLVLLDFFGLSPGEAFAYGIFLHVGTMAAVLVKYRGTWAKVFEDKPLVKFLAVASVFTGVSGLVMYFWFKSVTLKAFDGGFMNAIIGFLLIVTGIALYLSHKKVFGVKSLKQLSLFDTAVVGLAQGFSILPGVSRSGVTVSTLVLSEVRQDEALRLSFLLSVPAVAGAVVLELLTDGLGSVELGVGAAGLLASFISGYALMDALILFAKRVRFDIFCILFGLLAVLATLAF
ncbi:MAG: hypothetical protein GF416_03490 [Candidatus Altiarchaeales archaeon]|nr:hypothetical protein [Candidatus Altiarchaeales archaeon]MBD3416183.1 hypothetical protein [Candidatus Altiarchaeales archaeon]